MALGKKGKGFARIIIPDVQGPVVPAVITNAQATNIGQTTATVSWNVAPASTGRVAYGPTSGYGSLSTLEPSNLTFHSQVLSGLTPGQLYHYAIMYGNAGGSGTEGVDRTFTTLSASDPITYTNIPISGIDATGATDVTAALNNWFAANLSSGADTTHHPNIQLPINGTYLLSAGLNIGNKHHFTIDMRGCRLKLKAGSGGGQLQTLLLIGKSYNGSFTGCTDVQIHDGVLEASNYIIDRGFSGSVEQQHAMEVDAGSNIRIWNMRTRGCGGDFIKIGDAADNVHIYDSVNEYTGRNGFTVICGSNILMENVDLGQCGYYVFDPEPNTASEFCTDITFRNSSFLSWGPNTGSGGGFFASAAAAFLAIDRITIDGIHCYGTTNRSSFRSFINQNHPKVQNDIVFTNCSAVAAENPAPNGGSGALIDVRSVNNFRFTGNSFPLRSGQALMTSSSLTGTVVTSPNP